MARKIRIDPSTEEGQREINMLYADAVIEQEDDKIAPPYQVSCKNYDAYEKALYLLAELKAKRKCTFEYLSIYEPYDMHYVTIHWNMEDETGITLSKREVIEIVEKFDELTIFKEEPDEWMLSTKIYYPKETKKN